MGSITTILPLLTGGGAVAVAELARRHVAGVRLEGQLRRIPPS